MTPPAFIGSMSSGRLFLGELLSSRARLRFPGHAHTPTIHSRSSSKTQRTANRDFSLCLTPGVHPTLSSSFNSINIQLPQTEQKQSLSPRK